MLVSMIKYFTSIYARSGLKVRLDYERKKETKRIPVFPDHYVREREGEGEICSSIATGTLLRS